MKSSHRPNAFTLVEILVVVALLVALMILSIPVGKRAYQQSQASKCLGNLRTYSTAVLSFHSDMGAFPKWDGQGAADTKTGKAKWAEWLIPSYLPESLRCPLKPKGSDVKGFHYTANSGLCIFYQNLKGLPVPYSKVVLAKEASAELEGFWSATHFNMTVWGNPSPGEPNQNEGKVHVPQFHGSREERGLALFFLDGHSEIVAAPGNNWKKGSSAIYGSYTNGGLIYDQDQLGEMSRGVWHLKP